jgi:membrane protease YdiL (CAAX protease family)
VAPPDAPDDRFAADLRRFGPIGLMAIVVILAGNLLIAPLSALLVLLWAWRSRTPWREIGYVQPRSWIRIVIIGIAFGIAFKILMKAIVMPLLGADPINQPYHYLVGNSAAVPGMLFSLIVVAGFGEETLFRGYMFERFGKLFGTGVWPKASIVVLTATLFALLHYADQGVAGAEQALVVGLVFGIIFGITGTIAMLMIAHAAFDLTALAMIYWNVESVVAHLVFKSP